MLNSAQSIRASQLGREQRYFALAYGAPQSVSRMEITSATQRIIGTARFIKETPQGPIYGLDDEIDLNILIGKSPVRLESGICIGYCSPVPYEGVAGYVTPYNTVTVYNGIGEVVLYVLGVVVWALGLGFLINGWAVVQNVLRVLGVLVGGGVVLYLILLGLRLALNLS